MSDMLTHWGIFEDCRRLALIDERMDPFIAKVMDDDREIARLGAISRAGSTFVPHILKQELAKKTAGREGDIDGRKLAFALGGITHYPTDIMMKPLMSLKANADWHQEHLRMIAQGRHVDSPAREVSAYYDTHVFKKVYLAGREDPFNRFMFAENDSEPGRVLEDFVYSLFQRALLSSHTLAPDKAHLDQWLDNLLARVQPLYINIRAFVDVYLHPDPEKMKAYGVETDFYLESDPAIVLARKVQAGEKPAQDERAAALDVEANASGYGLALCVGVDRLIDAGDFWNGRRDDPPDIKQGGKAAVALQVAQRKAADAK